MKKINIVNYEEGQNNGILTKFAVRMKDYLTRAGYEATVTPLPDATADICHHINYLPYQHERSANSKNTLMITHIWEGYKLDALRKGMETADMGICMSKQTMDQLIEWGLPKEKLTYILPAHDSKTRRHQVVAILTNIYPDGCKLENTFTELVKTLDWNKWAFRIMGTGWTDILTPLVAEGLQVDYFNDFDSDLHHRILESSDYALYFGKDEGSMGLLDAKQAGIKTIGIKQGFNIEMKLDYYFDTPEDLIKIFKNLNKNSVKDWTWSKYIKEHLKVWKKLN